MARSAGDEFVLERARRPPSAHHRPRPLRRRARASGTDLAAASARPPLTKAG
jgi:hypothetical protein